MSAVGGGMTEGRRQDARWFDDGVLYEVYARSFRDSNGDGVGDLRGVIAGLDYIASLGVDGVWLTPFQRSPQVDQGYDVSDYREVDPLFGTLADFDELLAAAHHRGLRVIVDLVPNHASVEHPLFARALREPPGSEARSWFHFVTSDTDGPPNDWRSVFGGPAWTRVHPDSPVDRDWYLHLFAPAQPDWNWRLPAVHAYFDDVLRFWLDRGVDGVRIDVAHGLYKAEGLPDAGTLPTRVDGLRTNPHTRDQEEVHEVYRRWRRIADGYSPPRLLVGEVNLAAERAARYVRPDELHQTFAFRFTHAAWDAAEWNTIGTELDEARRRSGGAPTWALENHDVVRAVTRFGGGSVGARRARAALVAMLGFPGSAYLYQGQELGLPEVDVPVEARRDPMWTRGVVSRDGTRVPLPWTAAGNSSHGFSAPQEVEAWLPQPLGWGDYAVDVQEGDEDSMLELTRAATSARRRVRAVLGLGAEAEWTVLGGGILRCSRGRLSVYVNFGSALWALPAGDLLIASAPRADRLLPPDSAAWLLTDS